MSLVGITKKISSTIVIRICSCLLGSCGSAETTALPSTPADLAVHSAASYADNESGVIESSRLALWSGDWPSERPPQLQGDLVILQLDEAPTPGAYLARAPGVRVYLAPELRNLVEPRNNGLVAIGGSPGNGIRIDSLLRRFDIQPNHDLVLLVSGQPSADSFAALASAWLVLRYWGFEHESLGVLNGSVAESVPLAQRTDSVAEHPFSGLARVTTLPNDHFALLADLGAVRDAIEDGLIVDARAPSEYEGATLGASDADETCLEVADGCSPTFSGRIAGASSLPWRSLVDEDGRLRSPAEIEAAVATAGITRDETPYVYDLDGRGSAVVVFALLGVVGQPARWYAASFLEWGALNASHPDEALQTLPSDSPWRTDVFPTLTEGDSTWADPAEGVRPLIFDDDAPTTDRVQAADRLYKQRPPILPPVGSGNDC